MYKMFSHIHVVDAFGEFLNNPCYSCTLFLHIIPHKIYREKKNKRKIFTIKNKKFVFRNLNFLKAPTHATKA